MRIDWDAFTSEITILMKTSGDTGDSGDTHRKGLNQNDKSVTAQMQHLSPLDLTGDTYIAATGDAFCEAKQSVILPVTGVTDHFEQGRAPFADCVRRLRTAPAPEAFWGDRWQRIIDDSAAFVATWGARAHKLGWREIDLFGVHPTRPACRFDLMGLMPLTDGGEIIAMTDATATTRKPSGSIQRYTRRDQRDAVLLWEVK